MKYTYFLQGKSLQENEVQMANKKRKGNHEAQFPKLSVFVGQKSIFRYYCIQNVKDGIQIGVYKINNESVTHFNQFISVKVKKNLRKSQPRFREKTRTSRLRKNGGFPITKTMYS